MDEFGRTMIHVGWMGGDWSCPLTCWVSCRHVVNLATPRESTPCLEVPLGLRAGRGNPGSLPVEATLGVQSPHFCLSEEPPKTEPQNAAVVEHSPQSLNHEGRPLKPMSLRGRGHSQTSIPEFSHPTQVAFPPALHAFHRSLDRTHCQAFHISTSSSTKFLEGKKGREKKMARGNQREKAREANLKKQAAMVRKFPSQPTARLSWAAFFLEPQGRS